MNRATADTETDVVQLRHGLAAVYVLRRPSEHRQPSQPSSPPKPELPPPTNARRRQAAARSRARTPQDVTEPAG